MGPDFQQIEKVIDPISRETIAWRMICNFCGMDRWIWMDGRPHPPEGALHTWEGFNTGEWDGNTLVVTTTHLKESYIRRDGLSEGPRATVTEYFTRHGDYLDWTSIVDDPDYMTEPLIRNQTYLRFAGPTPPPWNCIPQDVLALPRGYVPHWLPGKNPDLTEYSTNRRVPFAASRGGGETLYPDERGMIPGDMLGSSQGALRELIKVAPLIGIKLSKGGTLSDRQAKVLSQEEQGVHPYWLERQVWFSFYETASASVRYKTALVFQ